MRRTKNNKVELFLDSGAYTAFSKGVEIDIQKYIKFIKKHRSLIDVYVNLDVIGSKKKGPTRDSAEATLENQRIMEDAGLSPMPVFHRGEPEEEYLGYYVENYNYVGLGMGRAIGNMGQIEKWLDRIFTQYICDEQGMPKVKIHGFGMTSLKLMLRYPWYSVDSTSWVATGRFGAVFVPKYRGGKWLYNENPHKITVSNRSPGQKNDKNHITNLQPSQMKIVLDYIHSKGYKLGSSKFKKVPEDRQLKENEKWAENKDDAEGGRRLLEVIKEPGLSNKYELRDELNITYFLDLEDSMPEWPWAFKPTKTTQPRML